MSEPITTEPKKGDEDNGVSNPAYPTAPPGAAPTPVTQQPQGQGMQMSTVGPPSPPGLEYLAQLDQLIVKQQVEILEAVVGWETNNKYVVCNKVGQNVYFAREESSCLQRQCCGPRRGFTIHILDNMNQEVMRMERDFKCCARCPWCACCDCCSHAVSVFDQQGNILGHVKQGVSCWRPYFTVWTEDNELVGHITGPLCSCRSPCCGDVKFPITGPNDDEIIGQIAKQWTGFVKEIFTDADTFSVSFPLDLDVKKKAIFFAALFLIDFMYFERAKKDIDHH